MTGTDAKPGVLHLLAVARGLGATERWLLARALVYLLRIDLLLRMFGIRHFFSAQRGLEPARHPGAHIDGPQAADRARQYGFWLAVAARHHFVPARCLHRSLALQCWLAHDGIRSEVQIGVRKDGAQLKAHAWVTVDGTVVCDADDVERAFTRFPSSAARTALVGSNGDVAWSA